MSKLNVQVPPPSTTLFNTKDYRTYMIIIERQNKRDAVSNIDIHSICMNTEANCQLYFFLSLTHKKKNENLMILHLPLAVLNIRLFSLWSLHRLQADDTLQILPSTCAHVSLHIYIYHEWSNRSYHLTFARPILFRREKRDKTRLSKKKHPPLDVIAFELIFPFFFSTIEMNIHFSNLLHKWMT
jgi:hypothetical protein